MAPHQLVDGRAREVAEVLVVDRVELAVVDQVLDVRVLDRRQPVVGEQDRESLDEAVQRRRVRHDVVRDDQVGAPSLAAQPPREVGVEELAQRRHAGVLGGSGLVGRRVDPEHGHVALHEVPEEVPVVRGDLDDERTRRRGRARRPCAGRTRGRAASGRRRTTRSRGSCRRRAAPAGPPRGSGRASRRGQNATSSGKRGSGRRADRAAGARPAAASSPSERNVSQRAGAARAAGRASSPEPRPISGAIAGVRAHAPAPIGSIGAQVLAQPAELLLLLHPLDPEEPRARELLERQRCLRSSAA